MSREYWAVIENGNDKVDTVDLGKWDWYEWSHFKTLKEEGKEEPLTFDTHAEAREFILNNFDDSEIEPMLINNNMGAPEGYTW